MVVYHGGVEAVQVPDLAHSRKAVDFGAGFYVTPFEAQATSWCDRRKLRAGYATLSAYEYDEQSAAALKILKFDSYSSEWLDFIVSCRAEQDVSDWDVVIGGVANDKVLDTLEAYFDGFATKEQTIDKLRYEKPNLQLCFRTPAALGKLKFLWSKRV